MLKTLLIIFIVIPIALWLSVMITNFVSIFLIMISVGLGSLVHRLFKGKPEMQWDPPEWIGITQMLIIQGLIWGTIFGVLGGILGWHWLIGLGSFLKYIFGTLLGLDILVLIILGTIHGYFDVFGEQ